ncbi:MAG: hypothetical protein H0V79_09155 [Actinobacteria bacterium]|nr:hypothetical protein [Actinomycetota bacterium]
MKLVYAELLKIRTAPWTTLILVFALLAIVGLGAAGTSNDANSGFVISPESDIINIAGIATIFTLILGILAVTWDYRHGTITQTFLVSPRRERVIVAKLVTALVLAALLTGLALALALGIAEVWLGDGFQLTRDNWNHAGRILVATLLWAVLGLGLGATLQTQVGALISAIVWFLVVEFVLVGLGSKIWDLDQYLPGEALREFASSGDQGRLGRTTAGLLAAAYAFGFAALGTLFALRRDVN